MPIYTCDTYTEQFDGWDKKVNIINNIDGRNEGNRDWVYDEIKGIFCSSKEIITQETDSIFVKKDVIEKLRLISPSQKPSTYTSKKDRNRLSNGLPIGIWYNWYAENAKAKAIKKLAKTLPVGDSIVATAIAVDDKQEMGVSVDFENTSKEGVVIDMEATEEQQKEDNLINGILEKISNTKNETDLKGLAAEFKNLEGNTLRQARQAWRDQSDAFEVVTPKQSEKNAITV